MTDASKFTCVSPIDYRYDSPELGEYLSEEAFTEYKLRAEIALVEALTAREICPLEARNEIVDAKWQVTVKEVYEEEDRNHHDIRALVNCIQRRVSDRAKPYVHMSATSFDISDTANAARYKDVMFDVFLPKLNQLEKALIELSLREANTAQIGRTHGQHAVPITFGFAIALYVERIGGCIVEIRKAAEQIVGKFSGAVGAYNASSLFFDDPKAFEAEVLQGMGLFPAGHSTQIVPPESRTRLFNEICILASVLANLADDMRHLQRSEIGEVGEPFEKDQVGSSTMPQKQNPINFENVKSMWKIVYGLQQTMLLDQISEHQRDLTNSASGRTYVEIIGYTYSMVKRMIRVMSRITVNKQNMECNLASQGEAILSEPLYIILASLGHPDAHEKVRMLNQRAYAGEDNFVKLIHSDKELAPYIARMSDEQRVILSDPHKYTGISAEAAKSTATRWKKKLRRIER